jgi:hypothetical protein
MDTQQPHSPYKIPYSALSYQVTVARHTKPIALMSEKGRRYVKDQFQLTSKSHNALSTFSSNVVSTRLALSLGAVERVSWRSSVGTLSLHLDAGGPLNESALERGWGELDLTIE